MDCAACGNNSMMDMSHKLTTYILKNPPEGNKKASTKSKAYVNSLLQRALHVLSDVCALVCRVVPDMDMLCPQWSYQEREEGEETQQAQRREGREGGGLERGGRGCSRPCPCRIHQEQEG